jgi:uncharacterized damage-inducible protein DinB
VTITVSDMLIDGFGRVRGVVRSAVDGLTADQLATSVEPGANTIAWLVWHLTRVQDDHFADLMGTEQVWTADGWDERFGLPAGDTGFGHRRKDMEAVRVKSADELTGYHDAVYQRTADWLEGLDESELDKVIDENWDPPVTLAVRLVSVLSDDLQHAGQAAYLKGVLQRRS